MLRRDVARARKRAIKLLILIRRLRAIQAAERAEQGQS